MADPLSEDTEGVELWNVRKDQLQPANDETHLDGALQQYKLYVASTDKISDRRTHANNFFLTLHSTVIAGIGYTILQKPSTAEIYFLIIVCAGALTLTVTWFLLIRSYSKINSAKFKVVGLYERRLSSSPFWRAEWKMLGHGGKPSLYIPLTNLEAFVPVVVALVYCFLLILLVKLVSLGGPLSLMPTTTTVSTPSPPPASPKSEALKGR
jgi:hypothetical protein